ncbi:hypothetical protein H3V53_35580 [Paraburkholderia bengalensis]|uniref:Uncharacterized protein n=1 Tax=Paraburkholderia bengalensis TaxID=2747562 RepID=A0ABU8J3B2_9BURK
MTDEYDVQDLLHGVLHLEFDDIRPEEWCPSYAGTGTRRTSCFPMKESSSKPSTRRMQRRRRRSPRN